MDKPLRLQRFSTSEGSRLVSIKLSRPPTDEEAERLARAIDVVIEREHVNLICDCGKRMGEHPAQAPWWPCMTRSTDLDTER